MDVLSKMADFPKDTLNRNGLCYEEPDRKISRISIVIGKNGAGKSRLLSVVKKYYNEHVVMCDFTKLVPRPETDDREGNDIPQTTLYGYTRNNGEEYSKKIYFNDEMKEIQIAAMDFLDSITKNVPRARDDIDLSRAALDYFRKEVRELLDYDVLFDKDQKQLFVQRVFSGELSESTLKENNISAEKLDVKINKFSPGELFLFYIAVFETLHFKDNKKPVLILDEPETHLHAAALRKFINHLKESEVFAQIWIATHSLVILPEFTFDDVIYISNGRIKARSSNTYLALKRDVLGSDSENKITEFFNAISEWMVTEFLVECLSKPEVVDSVNPNDKQVTMFSQFIRRLSSNKSTTTILDFGGGRFERLNYSLSKQTPMLNYEYYLCDSDESITEDERHFRDIRKINREFDCIVAMNVFHEINPLKWASLFKAFHRRLKDNGWMIFVERRPLSKGELPDNSFGYFVMGIDELRILFNIRQESEYFHVLGRDTIIGAAIHKTILSSVTMSSTVNAIHALQDFAWKNIVNALNNPEDVNRRREYAFYVQQYVNCTYFDKSVT